MSVDATDPISPELVLVCPELRAVALAALPQFPQPTVLPLEPHRPVAIAAFAYAAGRLAALALTSLLWLTFLALVVTVPLLP